MKLKPFIGLYLGLALPVTVCTQTTLPPLPIASCQTDSQPNPIAAEYPNLTTGTINGTVAILPIPYALARSIIPAQYPILSGYKTLLPNFPADQYPVIIEAVLDHDLHSGNFSIPDFSRVVLSYPFVDLLLDGHSNFRYVNYVLATDNPIVIGGIAAYGETPVPCTFDPPCDAYAFVPGHVQRSVYFKAFQGASQALGEPPAAEVRFAEAEGKGPYSLHFYQNVTNQPQFATGAVCDNFITLYNSSVTEGKYEPVVVKGRVSVVAPYFPTSTTFADVYGLKVDRAFIENNFMTCASLKGYSGTGPGD